MADNVLRIQLEDDTKPSAGGAGSALSPAQVQSQFAQAQSGQIMAAQQTGKTVGASIMGALQQAMSGNIIGAARTVGERFAGKPADIPTVQGATMGDLMA